MKKMAAILALVVLIGSNAFGHSLIKVMASDTGCSRADKYYTGIEIHKGDSLWSIAEQYAKDGGMTTEAYVEELKSMNGLKEDTIHSGQYLTVMYFTPEEDGTDSALCYN